MNRQIAGWVTHHWAKWVVLVLSLLVIGSMGFLGSKLTSVQNNEISSWLPGDAESTQVIDEARAFADPDAVPAVVLYERESGITAGRRGEGGRGRQGVRELRQGERRHHRPDPVEGRKALQTVVTFSIGVRRLGDPPRHPSTSSSGPPAARTGSTRASPGRLRSRPTRWRRSRASTGSCCWPPWPSSS